ncbi:hypothetical protein CYMTET_30325 [Cymbomonas tetramitiformis]|uniref:Uncharacterized protein n=1 Tax=Cymbomonas tetramitiformis TaxID=36881 RepID=A0AAE0FJ32_9CHLO|nr:hypothetical protein CYMTET_30325 [Cymbomonas tetramitiformis]
MRFHVRNHVNPKHIGGPLERGVRMQQPASKLQQNPRFPSDGKAELELPIIQSATGDVGWTRSSRAEYSKALASTRTARVASSNVKRGAKAESSVTKYARNADISRLKRAEARDSFPENLSCVLLRLEELALHSFGPLHVEVLPLERANSRQKGESGSSEGRPRDVEGCRKSMP